jgi:acyl carrier protein
MNVVSAQDVRSFILTRLHSSILEAGLDPAAIRDDFDMLTEGVIDSLGVVELLTAIEQHLGVTIDFADLDPESLTVVGPLSRYIESKCIRANGEQQKGGLMGHVPSR